MLVLKERTVGLVGFGRIGREVANRLQPFKCPIQVFDPAVPDVEIERAGFPPVSLQTLWETSDLISLHCPSNSQTRSMINKNSLSRMKRGTILINVARGNLVTTTDLIDALQIGHLAAAGLDVADPEPLQSDSPLLRMDNVLITNHIASTSVSAVRTLRRGVAETVAKAIKGEPLPNVVNGVWPSVI